MSPFLFALLVGVISRLSSSLGASTELYCRQKHGSPGHYEIHLDFLRHPDADHFANLTFTQGDMATFSLTSPSVKPTCVDLSFNRLIVWPELNCSTSVHYLNLSSNRLSQWNLATFPELRVLDLSHNSLMSVDLNALLRLPRLEVLYLHGNLIHIFSDLRRSPSLKTVILSAQDWYALNNIDFGPYPIHMLISTATAANAWRFRCSSRPDSSSVDLAQCREIFLTDIGRLSAATTCVSCYNCTEFIPAPVATTVPATDGPSSNSSRSSSCGGGGGDGGAAFVITTILLTSVIAALVSTIVALLVKMRRLGRERTARSLYRMPERVATISKASLREVHDPVVPMLFDPSIEKFSDVHSPRVLFRRERRSFDITNIADISDIADSSV